MCRVKPFQKGILYVSLRAFENERVGSSGSSEARTDVTA